MRFAAILAVPAVVLAASSAPAPANQVVGTSTYYQYSTVTITSCLPTVTDCPAKSTITSVTSIPVTTTTTYSKAPEVPHSVAKVETCAPPATVTSYVTVCPEATKPATLIPATSVPASSAPAKPATSVPSSSKPGVAAPTAVVPAKNSTLSFVNGAASVQMGGAGIIAVAGMAVLFL